MNPSRARKDLFVLVADQNQKATLEALLMRHEALLIRPIQFEVRPHPRNDPGVRLDAAAFLRPLCNDYDHALAVFDLEGCGAEAQGAKQLSEKVTELLSGAGWGHRAAAIVIDPELEIWAWAKSSKLDEICGWSGKKPSLRDWAAMHYCLRNDGKPQQPKEALEAALKHQCKVRSSAVFRQLAAQMSWKGCSDAALCRLLSLLQQWFAISQ